MLILQKLIILSSVTIMSTGVLSVISTAQDPVPPSSEERKDAAKPPEKKQKKRIDASDIVHLLKNPSIQKELGITKEQIVLIERLHKEFAPGAGGLSMSLRQTDDPEERHAVQNEIDTVWSAQRAKLFRVLSDRQAKRITQIYLQNIGMRAIIDPIVIERIGLSDEDCENITSILKAFDEMKANANSQYQEWNDRERSKLVRDDYQALANFTRSPQAIYQSDQLTKVQKANLLWAEKMIDRELGKRRKVRFLKLLGEPIYEAESDETKSKVEELKQK